MRVRVATGVAVVAAMRRRALSVDLVRSCTRLARAGVAGVLALRGLGIMLESSIQGIYGHLWPFIAITKDQMMIKSIEILMPNCSQTQHLPVPRAFSPSSCSSSPKPRAAPSLSILSVNRQLMTQRRSHQAVGTSLRPSNLHSKASKGFELTSCLEKACISVRKPANTASKRAAYRAPTSPRASHPLARAAPKAAPSGPPAPCLLAACCPPLPHSAAAVPGWPPPL